ncbi:hypothetical protein [Streptomyces broussonetiae]|uniref:hypothetical protein n=1 Tax=Streptomyces broussonetiae TaxID=2686304 RepID=UPI002D8053CD|nr:hypothetical protein [Streptomyces broussonetiae]
MFTKLSKIAVSVAAVATGLVATIGATEASAASAPLGHPRTAVHFNLAAGQTPENIALAPNGNQYVTFAKARQVAEVTRGGAVRILATMPLPADGGVHTPALGFPLTVGITRDHDGTLYFLYATGTTDLTAAAGPSGSPRCPRTACPTAWPWTLAPTPSTSPTPRAPSGACPPPAAPPPLGPPTPHWPRPDSSVPTA